MLRGVASAPVSWNHMPLGEDEGQWCMGLLEAVVDLMCCSGSQTLKNFLEWRAMGEATFIHAWRCKEG